MSGPSRVCYHGVPRIIEQSYAEPEGKEEMEAVAETVDGQVSEERKNGFKEVLEYFKTHRINVNVRQVWARKDH